MSNRLMGILIILGFIGFGYLYYNLSYIPEQEKIKQEEIIKQNEILKKDPELIKQESILKKELSSKEKIRKIREIKKNYKVIELDNGKKAIFKKESNNLGLYFNDIKIGTFDLVFKKYIKVSNIKGDRNDLFIEIGKEKYYYNNIIDKLYNIFLNEDILYVKKGLSNNIIIVTKKGSIIYSLTNKNLEFFNYFNDFTYGNSGYYGLIRPSDKRILDNLGIKKSNKNLIYYYNSKSKEKRKILETNIDVDKIYNLNGKIYLEDKNTEKYELKNI